MKPLHHRHRANDSSMPTTIHTHRHSRLLTMLVRDHLDVRHWVSSSSRIQWHLGWRLLSSSVFSEDIAQILLITDEIHGHHRTIVINCVRSRACCSSVFLLLHGSWNKDRSCRRHLRDVLIESDLFVSPGFICLLWPTDEIYRARTITSTNSILISFPSLACRRESSVFPEYYPFKAMWYTALLEISVRLLSSK